MPEWNEAEFNKLAEAEGAKPEAKPEVAPEPEPQAAPEQEAVAEEKPVEKVKEERVVPLGALHEERAKRRAEAERARALEAQIAQLNAQMQALTAAQQKSPPPPDPAVDPAGAILHQQKQTQEQLLALQQQQAQQRMAELQQAQVQAVVSRAQQDNAEFLKEQPDANEAINFLKTSRVRQYEAMGLPRQQALAQMQRDEWQLVTHAYQNGDNPARVAYEMAAAAGYVSPKQKMQMRTEGQKTAAPSGQGGQPGGLPSYETLLNMDSKSFRDATKGDKWRKLMSRS